MTGANGHVDWEMLARHVAGEDSEDEQAAIEAWAAADPKRRALIKELQQVWCAVGEEARPSQPLDVSAAWKRLDQRIREKRHEREEARPPRETEAPLEAVSPRAPNRRRSARAAAHVRRRPRRLRARTKAVLATAAVAVTIVIGAAMLLLGEGPFKLAGANAKVFTTARGQQATIRLADGTKVNLNVDSRLELSASGFAADRREVHLEGEAYFDVARDAGRPFWVHAGGASVRVLGTAFDVRAYTGEGPAQVAVAEGAVTMHADVKKAGVEEGASETSLQLRPQQVGTLGSEGLEVRRAANLSAYVSWTEGRLVFEDASIGAVARKLERWYDLRVEVRVRPETVDRLNAAFEDESPREVLDDVALALGLQYEKKQKVVTFYRSAQARSRTGRAAQPVLTR